MKSFKQENPGLAEAPHVLILDKNEYFMKSVKNWFKEQGFQSASLSAIGALKNVELGYYNLEKKEYQRKVFDAEDYELINLTANLSFKDGEPFVHTHVSLTGSDFQLFGGHLFEAQVAVTTEIIVQPLAIPVERFPHSEIGLHLIDARCSR